MARTCQHGVGTITRVCEKTYQSVGGEGARRVQEGRRIARRRVEGRDGDDETNDGYAVVGHDVETSLLLPVRRPRHAEGHRGAQDIGRRSEDEGHRAAAHAEAADHGREEVVEAVRGCHEDVHEDLAV